jgi:hypothetical protein
MNTTNIISTSTAKTDQDCYMQIRSEEFENWTLCIDALPADGTLFENCQCNLRFKGFGDSPLLIVINVCGGLMFVFLVLSCLDLKIYVNRIKGLSCHSFYPCLQRLSFWINQQQQQESHLLEMEPIPENVP